jgi:hypothetical protein
MKEQKQPLCVNFIIQTPHQSLASELCGQAAQLTCVHVCPCVFTFQLFIWFIFIFIFIITILSQN